MAYRMLGSVVVVALMVGLCGCKCPWGQKKEAPAQAVSLSDVPAPARATIDKLIAGGEIRKIEQEGTGNKAIYDVEATVQGKNVEYDVAADGRVLTSEESVPFASLPPAVQASATKYFGSAEGLTASKEIENGKTNYEVGGQKDGAPLTLKITQTGRIIEKEKE